MFDYIRADIKQKREVYYAHRGWFSRYGTIYLSVGSLAVYVYRFGRWIFLMKIPVLKQIFYLIYYPLKGAIVVLFGINIPVRADIGPGLVIHNFCDIFLPRSSIGKNFTCQQGVTLGAIHPNPGQPTVGDNVFMGAGSKAMGRIRIGDNVTVGANSLVINDVPDDSVVVGVPARIVSREKNPDRLVKKGK